MESQGNGNTAFNEKSGVFSNVLQRLTDVFNGNTRAEMILRPKYARRI
jgi:hypothetical protein